MVKKWTICWRTRRQGQCQEWLCMFTTSYQDCGHGINFYEQTYTRLNASQLLIDQFLMLVIVMMTKQKSLKLNININIFCDHHKISRQNSYCGSGGDNKEKVSTFYTLDYRLRIWLEILGDCNGSKMDWTNFFWISTSMCCMRAPLGKTRLHEFFSLKFIAP